MPTQFVNFTIPNYVADWDLLGKVTPISARFNRPPALSNTSVASILAAIGGTLKTSTTVAPCAPPSSFSPRRLKFSFATGGSLSVPFSLRSTAVALATQIKAFLTTDVGVVTCIELIGEKWGRVDEDLRPAATIVAAGADIRVTTGSKNPVFSRAYSYVDDSGRTLVQVVRQNTDSLATPAIPFSPYAAAINAALGAFLPKGCGGVGNIKPRHYTAKLLTTNTVNPVRQLIIPVASTASTAIRATGIAVATITQTMCLSYEGESDSRLSRLIP
jgi:hypothetical protein